MTRERFDVRGFVGVALMLFAALFVIGHCVGCGLWGQRAAGAVDVADYERDLDACLKEGRAARSLAVYEACAREADRTHGVKDGGK